MPLPVTQWRDIIHTEAGVTLATAGWLPIAPRAIALICHGHAEHLGRYAHVIAALAADGFAVYGVDHRGHGRSTGPRALISDFDTVAHDFRHIEVIAGNRHPGLPVVLIGHSMGGLIALRYALAYQDTLAALVTSGPALVIDEDVSPLMVAAGKALATIAPTAPVPRQGPGSAGCSLSTEQYICERFGIDHRTWHGATRARTAMAMLMAAADTRSRVAEIRLPLLAMHGADDTTTFPSGTRLLYDGVSSADKTMILWEGMRHEIFNSPGRTEVIATVRRWLAERVTSVTDRQTRDAAPSTHSPPQDT